MSFGKYDFNDYPAFPNPPAEINWYERKLRRSRHLLSALTPEAATQIVLREAITPRTTIKPIFPIVHFVPCGRYYQQVIFDPKVRKLYYALHESIDKWTAAMAEKMRIKNSEYLQFFTPHDDSSITSRSYRGDPLYFSKHRRYYSGK